MAAPVVQSLTNQFLIAMPGLDDPQFSRSVTYICEHTEEGAMGIVINRPIDMTLGEVMRQLEIRIEDERIENRPVFAGGPVRPERGFVLHRPHGEWESSLRITPAISLTTSRDILDGIASGHGPTDSLFALGYAGWVAGQLEAELADNAWLSVPADERVLFELAPAFRWRAAAELLGIDPATLADGYGRA